MGIHNLGLRSFSKIRIDFGSNTGFLITYPALDSIIFIDITCNVFRVLGYESCHRKVLEFAFHAWDETLAPPAM